MSTNHQYSFEFFQYGSFRLLRNSCERLVTIPTGTDLEGYVAVDRDAGAYAQARFLKSGDDSIKAAYHSIWRTFKKIKNSPICPQVLAITEFDSLYCCINTLPQGEPLNHFINRNGDLPAEVAVRLVLEFVSALRNHKPAFYKQYAISSDSIWISRTKLQPKLVLGEISPVKHSDPEAHNVDLCIHLLRYLTGNTDKNRYFQPLCELLISGPGTLEYVEETLSCFADAHPAANYWMGFNDPESLLERIISAEVAHRVSGRKESIIIQTAKRTFWPSVIAATLTVCFFMAYCLITIARDPDLAFARVPLAVAPVPVYQAPAPVVKVQPTVVTAPRPAPAPTQVAVVTPAPVIVRPPMQPATVVVAEKKESPISQFLIEPKVTPLLKALLADTGDLFRELLGKRTSEWLIPADPQKNLSKEQRAAFSVEDEKTLKMLELKKAAAEAKMKNLPYEAIRNEVAILKLQPDSLEARIRLHDCLSQVRTMQKGDREISPEEIEILVEASRENSIAQDILNQHSQKVGNWSR